MRVLSLFRRPAAVLAVTVMTGLGISGCGSSIDDAVKAPVTVTAPGTTVTVSATGAGGAGTTVSVTATVTGSAAETVTETVTESADRVDSSSTSSTSSSNPTGLKVGGAALTATSDDGAGTISVLSVQRKTAGSGEYSDPPKNGNYLLIDVSYLCTTGKFEYNPFDWKIRDQDGRTFDSSGAFSSGYDDSALHSGTIAKGAKARGVLVFDAPKGAVTLEYGDGYDEAPASWDIPA